MSVYDAPFLATLLPCVPEPMCELTINQIDSELNAIDARILQLTNSMRSVRGSLLVTGAPLANYDSGDSAPVLHLKSVFALSGLQAVLDTNIMLRNRLVYARSKAKAAA